MKISLLSAYFFLILVACGSSSKYRVPASNTCSRAALQEAIKQGLPLDDKGDKGLPLISYYTKAGALECVDYLIEAGANVNATDDRGWTPLIYSVYGQPVIFALLHKHGALLNTKTNQGGSALILAAEIGNTEALSFLIKAGGDVNQINVHGGTPIMHAAIKGQAKSIAILLKHGANPNVADNKQITPLMHAASNGHAEVIKTLLAAKVNVNAKDYAGFSAIMAPSDAAKPKESHLEIIDLLVQAGAEINEKNKAGDTALSLARKRKLEAVTSKLISLGAR